MHTRLIFIVYADWELSFPTAPNVDAWAGHTKQPQFFGWRSRELVPAGIELANGVCEVRLMELVSSSEFIARTPAKSLTSTYHRLMGVLCPAT